LARKRKARSTRKRAPTRRRAPARKRRARRSRFGAGLRIVVFGLGAIAFAVGFAVAVSAIGMDRIVTARFEGQRFRVPSRVYSTPSILYPGLDVELSGLRDTLLRLGYRHAPHVEKLREGEFAWERNRVRAHLRPFEHPSRPEPARNVQLTLRDGSIEGIRDVASGHKTAMVLLEPEQLGAYYGPKRTQRELVRLDDVPEHLVAAILSVEDQRFESHPGIDLRRIAGAMLANLRAGRVREGGSTLTQQLVKNFFLTPERTFKRKAQEVLMSLIVEIRYAKGEILEAYLNEIYLGQRGATAIHGVGEASRRFFGKRASAMTLGESALIAALIQSPNRISPYRSPERAIQRRNLVLDLMVGQKRIDRETAQRAAAEPLELAAITPDPGDARYFLDVLRRQLSEVYDEEVLTTQGLRIYSTLDGRMQHLAGVALRDGIEKLEKAHPKLASEDPLKALQGCVIALRPQTGEIVALVGGRDYRVSQFDRCTQARRQAGSIFKPFVYIAGLEPRVGGPSITLATLLDDSPLEIRTPSGPWRPQNFDRKFREAVSVRESIERSLNVATARLAQRVGIGRVADVARRLGVESDLPLVPSLALGAADVSPLEIARAYSTIASGGVRPAVQSIEDLVDSGGNTLERRTLRFERVIDVGTAYLATSLLEGVAERGTAAAVRATGLRGPIAGKTGTSDEERDLWFAGFTPDLVAVVWIGFDEPRSVGLVSSRVALPVWRSFVKELTGGRVRGTFPQPATVTEAEIHPPSGALAVWGCPERRRELFLEGTLPREVCPSGEVAGSGDRGFRRTQRLFFDWLRKHL
jgi:penicillin-binding protein 1B